MEKTPYQIAEIAVKALDSKKGMNIQVLHVGDITIMADYIVLASGSSTTQIKALAE
jgi:ribosome-associated protein